MIFAVIVCLLLLCVCSSVCCYSRYLSADIAHLLFSSFFFSSSPVLLLLFSSAKASRNINVLIRIASETGEQKSETVKYYF